MAMTFLDCLNRAITILVLFLSAFIGCAQSSPINAENGWVLPAKGKIRVLVVFVQIDYDKTPDLESYQAWDKDVLPEDADELFDPDYTKPLKGKITKFFDEASFGTYQVLGDYYSKVITVKESELNGRLTRYSVMNYVSNFLTEKGISTNAGLKYDDFDLWTNQERAGYEKKNEPDGGIDHLMMIVRNYHEVGLSTGFASQGSFGKINGKKTDSYSVFAGTDFQIMRHEYAHLIFGGNNFHCGGGQHNGGGTNYFIPLQGGWSTMGNYNSMFMTCNAWDRDRLNWKPSTKQYNISAIDPTTKQEINTDFSNENLEATQRIVLRDFITSGDAIRLKLPHLDGDEYPQWLWIENHQTQPKNGSEFDQFFYAELDCKPQASPGIYAYLQVDKNTKEGKDTYRGYGDYLRVLPANGFYDVFWEENEQNTSCANSFPTKPFYKDPAFMNALTGTSDVEHSVSDKHGKNKNLPIDGKINRSETDIKWLENRNGSYNSDLPHMGLPSHGFSLKGNNEISMGTNPSSASMLTLVSLDYDLLKSKKPNNRKVILNGLKVEIVDESEDGSITLEITYENNLISKNQRWCADTIVLPNHRDGADLVLSNEASLIIDRGLTPTRVSNPDSSTEDMLFNSPTHFRVNSGAEMVIDKKSLLRLKNKSTLIVEPEAKLTIKRRAKVEIEEGSLLHLIEGAEFNVESWWLRRKWKVLLN